MPVFLCAMILVSACLAGLCTSYRAGANPRNRCQELLAGGSAVPFCPEQLGGLPTPRPPAEIRGGDGGDVLDGRARVLNRDGADVTEQFIRGAQLTLQLAQAVRAEMVILKERSPSCGVDWIYDGTFTGTVVRGCGVTTALLRRNGLRVLSDEQFAAGETSA